MEEAWVEVADRKKGAKVQRYAKLDTRKKRVLLFKNASSRFSSGSFDLSGLLSVECKGRDFAVVTRKKNHEFSLVDEAHAGSWETQLNSLVGSSSSGERSPAVSRSSAHRPIGGGSKLKTKFSGLLHKSGEKSTETDDIPGFDVKPPDFTYPASCAEMAKAGKKLAGSETAPDMLALANAVLTTGDALRAVACARQALRMSDESATRQAAIQVMDKALQYVVDDDEVHTDYEESVAPLCQRLQEERSALTEAMEEDAEREESLDSIASLVFDTLIPRLVSLTSRAMGKTPCRFSVHAIGLASSKDWLPYDGLSLGIVTTDYADATVAFFRRYLAVLELFFAMLGETGLHVLPNAQAQRCSGSGLMLRNAEDFGDIELIGSPAYYVSRMGYQFEANYPLQSARLALNFVVEGDKATSKRFASAMQEFLRGYIAVPLGYEDEPSYSLHFHPKMPNKKKLEMLEAPLEVGRLKARSLARIVACRWQRDLVLEGDTPLPVLMCLKREAWDLLYYCVVAISLCGRLPLSGACESMLQAVGTSSIGAALGKRSTRHLQQALRDTRALRLAAQLAHRSSNEFVYHAAQPFVESGEGFYCMGKSQLHRLLKLYRALLPMYLGAADFASTGTLTNNTFQHAHLKYETPWLKVVAYRRMGMHAKALAALEEIRAETKNGVSLPTFLSLAQYASDQQKDLGCFNSSVLELAVARSLLIDQQNEKAIALIDSKIGTVLQDCQQFADATVFMHRALEYCEENKVKRKNRICLLLNLGAQCMLQGDGERALQNFQKAAELANSAGTRNARMVRKRALHAAYPHALLNSGQALAFLGRHEEAVAAFENALSEFRKQLGRGTVEEVLVRLNLGSALAELGREDEGMVHWVSSTQRAMQMYGRHYKLIGSLFDMLHAAV